MGIVNGKSAWHTGGSEEWCVSFVECFGGQRHRFPEDSGGGKCRGDSPGRDGTAEDCLCSGMERLYGKGDNMKENKGQDKEQDLLIRELKEKLDWYTLYASEEEYDEKAVESILYLLDRAEPIAREDIPAQADAWERFKSLAAGQEEELLPLTEEEEAGKTDAESMESGKGKGKGDKVSAAKANMAMGKNSGRRKFMVRAGHFVVRHKYIAAAILILVIYAVSNTARAIATGDPGFFYWLKQDDSGTTMITSPEGLDAATDMSENTYLSKDEMPDWTQEWLATVEKFEVPEGYEWQCYETSETTYRQYVDSKYFSEREKKEIVMGAWIYQDTLSYHEEGFFDFIHVGNYEIGQQEMQIYSKTEQSGEVKYIICFYYENCKYFIQEQDNLDELKVLATQYWNYVKNKKKI